MYFLKPLLDVLAVCLIHDCITERTVEAFQDARREKKGLDVLWLSSQHFLSQIVKDVALIPAHLFQQSNSISPLWQRKSKQLQAYEPALCASCHFSNCFLWELDAHHLIQESSGLLNGTAQLLCAHFQGLPTYPQQ